MATPESKAEAHGNLIIGEGVRVVGQLTVPSLAVINGTLEGGLEAADLIVGPQGSVTGKVKVRKADIHGHTFDTLLASDYLCLRSSGVVSGKISYGEIEIEKGGVIQGEIGPRVSADSTGPTAVAQPIDFNQD